MVIEQKRNETFDIIKGIAIVLVVWGHLQAGEINHSVIWIASCHMPVFLFVSGYFFEISAKKYNCSIFIKKKVKSLLLPYLLWSTVALIANCLMSIIRKDYKAIKAEAIDIFIYARSVWFLLVLFLAMIIAYCLYKVSNGNLLIYVLISCALCIALNMNGKIEILSLYKLEWLWPFFLLGTVASRADIVGRIARKMEARKELNNIILIVAIVIIDNILLAIMCNDVMFKEFYVEFTLHKSHVLYYIALYLLGIVGISIVIMISIWLSQLVKWKPFKTMISLIGRYSMDIYVIHMFCVKILLKVVRTIAFTKLAMMIISFIGAFVICGMIVFCVKRMLNKIGLYQVMVGRG